MKAPTGIEGNTPVPPGSNPTIRPPLPGQGGDKPNPPPLPGSGPQPKTPIPAFWQDPIRIIRTVLDLWEKDPAEAAQVHEFAKAKLAKIAAGG